MEKQKTAFLTGINGQDGSYLAEQLLEKGYKVYGLYRRSASPHFENISHIKDKLNLICGDLTDPTSINDIFSSLHFNEVYNLAAQSFVGASFNQPHLTFNIDAMGVLNLLEAIRKYSPDTRFYQASTSEMFGSNYSSVCGYGLGTVITNDRDEKTVGPVITNFQNEMTSFKPESPYAVAKVAAHHMCQLYRRAYKLHISCGILFNHESERRGIEFVTRKITDYVGKLINGKADEKLKLGNLEASRDWGHAEDFVNGMWLMLQQDVSDDYVLSTGVTHTIKDFLDEAFGCAALDWKNYVVQDPQFMRPSEVPFLRGLHGKAKEKLGWEPKIAFKTLVHRMVDNDIRIHSEK
jgi:GDPmannose 4,6-dehydratase